MRGRARVSGELPFRGHHDVAIIRAILQEEPKPIDSAVPLELRQVVGRALKKKPEARYGTAEEMLADLRRVQEAQAAEAAGVLNIRSLLRRLRQPRVAMAAAAGLVVVAVLSAWYAQRRADIRWAREVALPEIEQIVADNDVWRNLVPAYRLAEQAERYIPRDPKLAELFAQVSLNVNILTEPPGASVFVKEYATPAAEWEYLRVTPLEQVRMPVGFFRWKLEKEGYETVLAAGTTWKITTTAITVTVVGNDLVRTLDPVGSLPPRMVKVPATETEIGTLGDFLVGRYEVTNREYKAFVDQTGLPGPSTWMGGDYPRGQEDYPVSGVSWYEAAAYAEYRGMSLPTRFHWLIAMGWYTPMIQFYPRRIHHEARRGIVRA